MPTSNGCVDRVVLTRCEKCGDYAALEYDFVHMLEVLFAWNDDNLYGRPCETTTVVPIGEWYGGRIVTVCGNRPVQPKHMGRKGRKIGLLQLQHMLQTPIKSPAHLFELRKQAYDLFVRSNVCPPPPEAFTFTED